MNASDILATRTLCAADASSEEQVVLMIGRPFEDEMGGWRCAFDFDKPIHPRGLKSGGVDPIQAFLICLNFARLYLETSRWKDLVQWQGLRDYGLPASGELPPLHAPPTVPDAEPDPGNAALFAKRLVGIPDPNGIETEATLYVYEPFQGSGGAWFCGFRFDTQSRAAYYHGQGADSIESMLDALSLARVVYESLIPPQWEPQSEHLLSCAGFPMKVNRSFWV